VAEPADEEAFLRSFRERVEAERQPAEFIRAFERRASARRSARFAKSGGARPWVVPVAAAAALVLALLAGVVFQGRTGAAPTLVQAAPDLDAPAVPVPAPIPPLPVPPSRTEREPEPLKVPPPAPLPGKVPEPVEPARPPEEPPVPAPRPAPLAVPAPAPRTIAAVVQVQVLEGEAWVLHQGRREKGPGVPPGAGVATSGMKSRAAVLFPDGTRLTLAPDTVLTEIQRGPKGTRVHLERGSLTGDIERQPADQPLVFVTAHAEARVLGTVLKLGVEGGATRLEVRQGRVRLSKEGRSLDVSGGQYALAGSQGFIPPRPVHPDEVVLLPQEARLVGNEWTVVRDPKASSGWALEAGSSPSKPWDPVEERLAYVMFTFHASSEREYRLWVRTTSMERGDAWLRDQVVVEPVNAKLSRRCEKFGAAPTSAYVFTGVAAAQAGYSWLSGHGEAWKVEDPPITVRFKETGLQTLRLFVGHPWVRVDSIWLSATQKQRPASKLLPPAGR
jgi:ferric-dicitrate binding protein FerR (iron transport regulator)